MNGGPGKRKKMVGFGHGCEEKGGGCQARGVFNPVCTRELLQKAVSVLRLAISLNHSIRLSMI